MSKIKLFSHIDLDGIGCAVLAYLAFGRENVDVEYCGYDDINEKVCEFLNDDELVESYDQVFITDISVNSDVASMIDGSETAKIRVKLFDHHATALHLNEFDWCNVRVFGETGLKTCGTELFYEYLRDNGRFNVHSGDDYWNNSSNAEKFAEIVRDYDTWRWKEEGSWGQISKNLNDLFGIYGREKFIDIYVNRLWSKSMEIFASLDLILLENRQNEIDIYVKSKEKQLVKHKDLFGNDFGVVFAERFVSELGNRLSENHPELAYIAMIDMGNRRISYRTVRDGIHLGTEIAHSYGGGGHDKAAGSNFGIDIWDSLVSEVFMFGSRVREEGEVLVGDTGVVETHTIKAE